MTEYDNTHSSSPNYGRALYGDELPPSALDRAHNAWGMEEAVHRQEQQKRRKTVRTLAAVTAAGAGLVGALNVYTDTFMNAPEQELEVSGSLLADCSTEQTTTGFIPEGGGISNLTDSITFNLPEGFDRPDARNIVTDELRQSLFESTPVAPGEYAVPASCDIVFVQD